MMGGMHVSRRTFSGGDLLLLLLGIPFLGTAGVVGYFTVSTIRDHQQAQGWAEVPARIETVELDRRTSDGSTTYRVLCTYTYEWEGRSYTGERVGLSGGSDNIGSWHQDTYQRLRAAHRGDQPVPCYVNPADPEEAVLDRELRLPLLLFQMVFVTVFGAAGIGMTAGAIYLRRQRRASAAAAARHPNEPWMHKPDWAAGVLHSNVGTVAIVAWIIAIFWNVASLPAVVFVLRDLRTEGVSLSLLGLIFPVVGAGILAFAVHRTLQKRKFGGSHLKLETVPGVVGGYLRGELVICGDLRSLDAVDVTLKCVRAVTTGSGKNSTTTNTVLWQENWRQEDFATTFGQTELRLPLEFQIPYSCEPFDQSDPRNTVTWQLSARASIPGVDLKLDFDVPVFRTEASDASIGEPAGKVAAREAVLADDQPPPGSRIRREMDGPSPSFTIVCWPGIGVAAMVAVFALIFGGVALATGVAAVRGETFLFLFTAVFGAIALGIGLLLTSFLGVRHVTLAPNEVRIRRQGGLVPRRWSVPLDDVQKVTVKESASSGDSRWYAVHLERRHGRKIALAGMIPDELAARWLARQIERHWGLEEQAALASVEQDDAED